MKTNGTIEPQYNDCLKVRDEVGIANFGLMSNQTFYDDPKRLTFLLSRYKFAAKMLSGKKNVLEVGCADAFASRIVLQEVETLTAIDFDPIFIEDAKNREQGRWKINLKVHDILKNPVDGKFDGVYSLDVLEHIMPTDEKTFLTNITASMTEHGVLVIGSPSLESQTYASPQSKAGHVNCKSYKQMRELMLGYFYNVLMFSMNDEVVHTGFGSMAHYLLAVCCSPKSQG